MPRTVVNLDEKDKAWLDQQAVLRRVPMTELVRRAVHDFRVREQCKSNHPLQDVLARTAGIWQVDDGGEYQERIRKEWT